MINLPIKNFRLHHDSLIDDIINKWELENGFKVDGINVCPIQWHMNKTLDRVTDMEILVTVNYHKKRNRKVDNNG